MSKKSSSSSSTSPEQEQQQPMVLFKHLRNMQRIRPPPLICTADKLTLDQIAAYNIHVDTGDTKTSSIVTLREVPSFLIEAFSKFEQLEGCKIEGVFRKEGNSLRCKEDALPVFFGAQSISSTFLVHDVCSWIKKFFRQLRQPLFLNREERLIKFAESLEGNILFMSLLSLLDRLPASHLGTLGYLMRCLQEIAESSPLHQMTLDNLATVFAPSIFRRIQQQKEPKMSKKRNGSQDDLLQSLKRTNELQVKVIKVLIENAEKIGAAKDCYKASRSASDAKNKERKLMASSVQRTTEVASSSAASASKSLQGYGGVQMRINSALMKKNSRSSSNLTTEPSTSSLLSQRNSDDDGLNSPRKAKQKRSNSAVRMFKTFKKSLTNLNITDAFLSTPDPLGLANKKIPKPSTTAAAYRQQTPITQSVSMDSSSKTSCPNSNDEKKENEPPEGEEHGSGVVHRRIQQFKNLSLINQAAANNPATKPSR